LSDRSDGLEEGKRVFVFEQKGKKGPLSGVRKKKKKGAVNPKKKGRRNGKMEGKRKTLSQQVWGQPDRPCHKERGEKKKKKKKGKYDENAFWQHREKSNSKRKKLKKKKKKKSRKASKPGKKDISPTSDQHARGSRKEGPAARKKGGKEGAGKIRTPAKRVIPKQKKKKTDAQRGKTAPEKIQLIIPPPGEKTGDALRGGKKGEKREGNCLRRSKAETVPWAKKRERPISIGEKREKDWPEASS